MTVVESKIENTVTDKDAPISEVADVLVVADVMPFVTALSDRLKT